MLTVKLFEIRDSATFIPVMAAKMQSFQEAERYLLGRCGYSLVDSDHAIIVVTRLNDCLAANNPHEWGGGTRTMPVAHDYIEKHFDELMTGDVIDVEFILGMKAVPKSSERFLGGVLHGI